jgi:hypothetical protein
MRTLPESDPLKLASKNQFDIALGDHSTRKENMKSTLDTIEEPGISETGASSERHVRIQTRAYELYLARGEASGNELDDWLQAKLEIDNELIS